jgi:hypothetical protein
MEPKKYRMMMDQLTRPGKPKPKVNKTNTLDNISKRIEEAVDLYEDQPVPQTRIKPLQELEKDLANNEIQKQVVKYSPNKINVAVENRGKQTEALINTTNKLLKNQIKKGNIKKEDLMLRQDPNGLMVNKNRTIAIRDSFMAKQFNRALGVNDEPQATPEQVGKLAERLERNAQMTGGKGPFTNIANNLGKKKPIKKKTDVNYSDFKIDPILPPEFFKPTPPSEEYLRQERNFKRIVEEQKNKPQGLPGILGITKKDYE